jgi:galactokinase
VSLFPFNPSYLSTFNPHPHRVHTDLDAFPDPADAAGGVAGRDDAARGDKLRQQNRERFGAAPGPAAPAVVARAPGRVNLIGGHTDYSGGFVLPTTIDRATYVAVRRRSDERVRLYATAFDEEVSYRLAEGPPHEGWAAYAGGMADALCRRERLGSGFEAIIDGDVPLGAGLSSSAALEMATAVALDMLFADVASGGPLAPVETAQLGQQVEHEYAGVECGIMDQFAARLGRAGHALFLDCRSLSHEHVPLQLDEREAALVVTDTGVRRELAASKYNERREECQRAAAALREHTDEDIQALRDATPDMLETHGSALPEPLDRRARHVVSENARVLDAKEHLDAGDLGALGNDIFASHASLRDDYEVSSPELDALVEAARDTDGVLGARMTGGGFGGCTVTLARRPAVERFQQHARQRFAERFDEQEPTFYVIEDNVEAGMVG